MAGTATTPTAPASSATYGRIWAWRSRGATCCCSGAGGAARGIMFRARGARPRTLAVANRTVAKAEVIAARLRRAGTIEAVPPAALAGRRFDVVINATSAGMTGDHPAAVAVDDVRRGCFRLRHVYADAPTTFLRWARAAGVERVADGLGMLIEQAAESFPALARRASRYGARLRAAAPAGDVYGRSAGSATRRGWLDRAPDPPRAGALFLLVQLWFAAHIVWYRYHPPARPRSWPIAWTSCAQGQPACGARLYAGCLTHGSRPTSSAR